jgi:hypothetical protein
MSNILHVVIGTVWTPSFFVGMIVTSLMAKFLFRPVGDWCERQREGKAGVLGLHDHVRFMKNGGRRICPRWWDHCRAWWGHFTWRWSRMGKEARESGCHVSLPPPGLGGCYFR